MYLHISMCDSSVVKILWKIKKPQLLHTMKVGKSYLLLTYLP